MKILLCPTNFGLRFIQGLLNTWPKVNSALNPNLKAGIFCHVMFLRIRSLNIQRGLFWTSSEFRAWGNFRADYDSVKENIPSHQVIQEITLEIRKTFHFHCRYLLGTIFPPITYLQRNILLTTMVFFWLFNQKGDVIEYFWLWIRNHRGWNFPFPTALHFRD